MGMSLLARAIPKFFVLDLTVLVLILFLSWMEFLHYSVSTIKEGKCFIVEINLALNLCIILY